MSYATNCVGCLLPTQRFTAVAGLEPARLLATGSKPVMSSQFHHTASLLPQSDSNAPRYLVAACPPLHHTANLLPLFLWPARVVCNRHPPLTLLLVTPSAIPFMTHVHDWSTLSCTVAVGRFERPSARLPFWRAPVHQQQSVLRPVLFCPTTLTSTSLPSVKNEGHIGIRTRISGLQIHRTTVVLCTQWVIRPKFVAPDSFKRPRRHASHMVFRLSDCEKFITPSVFHFQSLFLIANLVEQASTDSFNFTSKNGFGAVP